MGCLIKGIRSKRIKNERIRSTEIETVNSNRGANAAVASVSPAAQFLNFHAVIAIVPESRQFIS
jgi:hypothetical protein